MQTEAGLIELLNEESKSVVHSIETELESFHMLIFQQIQ